MRFLLLFVALLGACTSLGHGGREVPKVEKASAPITEVALDGDDKALAVAVEAMLEAHGVKVRLLASPRVHETRGDKEYRYDEVQTRFVVRVRSADLDTCMPEGSTQMDFYVSVTDFSERNRVFLMEGEHGCKDSLVKNLERWIVRVNGK